MRSPPRHDSDRAAAGRRALTAAHRAAPTGVTSDDRGHLLGLSLLQADSRTSAMPERRSLRRAGRVRRDHDGSPVLRSMRSEYPSTCGSTARPTTPTRPERTLRGLTRRARDNRQSRRPRRRGDRPPTRGDSSADTAGGVRLEPAAETDHPRETAAAGAPFAIAPNHPSARADRDAPQRRRADGSNARGAPQDTEARIRRREGSTRRRARDAQRTSEPAVWSAAPWRGHGPRLHAK